MELEKVKQQLKPATKYLVNKTEFTQEDVEDIIQIAWQAGYEFRLQEEELNKGASF